MAPFSMSLLSTLVSRFKSFRFHFFWCKPNTRNECLCFCIQTLPCKLLIRLVFYLPLLRIFHLVSPLQMNYLFFWLVVVQGTLNRMLTYMFTLHEVCFTDQSYKNFLLMSLLRRLVKELCLIALLHTLSSNRVWKSWVYQWRCPIILWNNSLLTSYIGNSCTGHTCVWWPDQLCILVDFLSGIQSLNFHLYEALGLARWKKAYSGFNLSEECIQGVCVCVCVCVCVRVCVRACVRVCVWLCVIVDGVLWLSLIGCIDMTGSFALKAEELLL